MTTFWRNDHLDDPAPSYRDIWYPADFEDANLESSLNEDGTHSIVLDLDYDHEYRPSTTPGHGHLVIPAHLTWDQYKDLLDALYAAGVIQYGFYWSALRRGATFVRRAGVTKPAGAIKSSEDEGWWE